MIMLVLSLAFLSACGQKGALFLPGDPSTLRSIPTAEQLQQEVNAERDKDEEDDDEDSITNIQ